MEEQQARIGSELELSRLLRNVGTQVECVGFVHVSTGDEFSNSDNFYGMEGMVTSVKQSLASKLSSDAMKKANEMALSEAAKLGANYIIPTETGPIGNGLSNIWGAADYKISGIAYKVRKAVDF